MILLLLLENLKSKRSSEDFGKYSKNVTVYFNTWKSCFERLYLLNLFIECKNHFDELLEPFPNTIEMFTMLNEIGIKLFIVDEFLGPFSNYFYLKYLQCWMESPIWHSVLFPCHFILLYFFLFQIFFFFSFLSMKKDTDSSGMLGNGQHPEGIHQLRWIQIPRKQVAYGCIRRCLTLLSLFFCLVLKKKRLK